MIEHYMLSNPVHTESVASRLAQKTKFNQETGCIEWTARARANGGYGTLCVGRRGHVRAHRAAWVLRYGIIPEGLYVCHSCDNPLCCNVDHLFLGTPKQNMHDKETKGRGVKPPVHFGEAHHKTKTTYAEVDEIRSASGTLREIASRYLVSSKTVWRIKKGLTWKMG
jgi:hypothetical protein